jgi:hypothetical protein
MPRAWNTMYRNSHWKRSPGSWRVRHLPDRTEPSGGNPYALERSNKPHLVPVVLRSLARGWPPTRTDRHPQRGFRSRGSGNWRLPIARIAGTYRMGTAADSVISPDLRVRCLEGLRIGQSMVAVAHHLRWRQPDGGQHHGYLPGDDAVQGASGDRPKTTYRRTDDPHRHHALQLQAPAGEEEAGGDRGAGDSLHPRPQATQSVARRGEGHRRGQAGSATSSR